MSTTTLALSQGKDADEPQHNQGGNFAYIWQGVKGQLSEYGKHVGIDSVKGMEPMPFIPQTL